jgi:hypothetical protein
MVQQQQQQAAVGMGRPGQAMSAQMAQAFRQASAQQHAGFIHPNFPQGMTPQQQQQLIQQHQQHQQQLLAQHQHQQSLGIARPASAAPQIQQPGQAQAALQQRYIAQQSQSPASPAMTARSGGMMSANLPTRQQSLPVGVEGQQLNGQFFPTGSMQHVQHQQAQAQQQLGQTVPSPHLNAQQMQQQKMLMARNANGTAMRATTPLQHGQAGFAQLGPGPMQGQVPQTPQTMQLQTEQRARLVAVAQQQQQAQQQLPTAQQHQLMQQQQQQQQQQHQHAQQQQQMQRQMDVQYAGLGLGPINLPAMMQALGACNLESRNPENMNAAERVSLVPECVTNF